MHKKVLQFRQAQMESGELIFESEVCKNYSHWDNHNNIYSKKLAQRVT